MLIQICTGTGAMNWLALAKRGSTLCSLSFVALCVSQQILQVEGADSKRPEVITDQNVARLIEVTKTRPPDLVEWDSSGNCVAVTLRGSNVNTHILGLVARCSSVNELIIVNETQSGLTPLGIEALSSMTNLTRLSLSRYRELPLGIGESVSKLTQLRSLHLYCSYPKAQEYPMIGNLTNLEELVVLSAPNFSDADLRTVAKLPKLRRLRLIGVGVSDAWKSSLGYSATITNVTVTRFESGNDEQK